MIEKALKGGKAYWAWVFFLLVIVAGGFVSYLYQLSYGLGITGLSRSVSWGLYIANLTFFVGVAASAVTVVLPYYLHNIKEFGKMVILGEFLAISAVIMSTLSVFVDLGRPDRVFNLLLHPSPRSPLFWDVIVLTGYLLLNLVIGWSTLDAEHKGEKPLPWVRFLIVLSIPWAVSIHTVTAFIYQGLVARPLWHTPLWAPRFLSSAFASGPALLILMSLFIRRVTRFDVGRETIQKIATIATYALLVNLFLLLVELFTTLYGGVPEDVDHLRYLFLGIDGHSALVVWIWLSVILMAASALVLVIPPLRRRESDPCRRLRRNLCRCLDRQGIGPRYPRVHSLDTRGTDRVLPHPAGDSDPGGHLGLRPSHYHPSLPDRRLGEAGALILHHKALPLLLH